MCDYPSSAQCAVSVVVICVSCGTVPSTITSKVIDKEMANDFDGIFIDSLWNYLITGLSADYLHCLIIL